jgi:hypothetical protein
MSIALGRRRRRDATSCWRPSTGPNEAFLAVGMRNYWDGYEGGGNDRADSPGIEADPAQCLERYDEQGVRAFTDASDAAEQLVVGLLVVGQSRALGLLDRHAQNVGGALIAQVGQADERVADFGECVGDAVGAGAGHVVLAAWPHIRDPQRPAVGG